MVELITYKDVIYMTIEYREGEEMELHWSKEMRPDGNSNPQKNMTRTRNDKYVGSMEDYLDIFFLSSLNFY